MISSGWSGLLQTLSLLFEVAPDEVTVASVLDTMIALTGPAKFLLFFFKNSSADEIKTNVLLIFFSITLSVGSKTLCRYRK